MDSFTMIFNTAFSLGVVLLWIYLIQWIYRDANKHGMSAVGWAVGAFFVHILCLGVYLLVRKNRGETLESEITKLTDRDNDTP